MFLLHLQATLIAVGVVLLVLAHRDLKPGYRWFRFDNPLNPFKTRHWYRTKTGFRLGITGLACLVLSGVAGFIYWTWFS
jgi:hypothetical protein